MDEGSAYYKDLGVMNMAKFSSSTDMQITVLVEARVNADVHQRTKDINVTQEKCYRSWTSRMIEPDCRGEEHIRYKPNIIG